MRLINARYSRPEELHHAYSTVQAMALVKDAFKRGTALNGLDKLRCEQHVLFDRDVVRKVETGEWLLVARDAYFFDWGHFENPFQRKLAEHQPPNAKALLPPRPLPAVLYGYEFCVVDKAGKRLAFLKYMARVNGLRIDGVTDADGPRPRP